MPEAQTVNQTVRYEGSAADVLPADQRRRLEALAQAAVVTAAVFQSPLVRPTKAPGNMTLGIAAQFDEFLRTGDTATDDDPNT